MSKQPDNVRLRFYFLIPVFLDAKGKGPCKITEAHDIRYEVWDQVLDTHGSHKHLPDAWQQVEELNREYYKDK